MPREHGKHFHYKRGSRQWVLGHFWSAVAWVMAWVLFFPVLWMVITSFKHESNAYTDPPTIAFHPTVAEYSQVFHTGNGAGGAAAPFEHSLFVTLITLVLVLALGIPAAYALSIRAVPRWRDVLFFFLATKMLPYVAAIVPIYIIAQRLGLLDNDWALVILYTGFNLPIAVWMIRSFLLEIPKELLEAARIEGANVRTELTRVILPIALPGIAATALICVIFTWNEFFFAFFLTTINGSTVPVFLSHFQSTEGEYWALLAAAATISCLPVILAGWLAQRQLVRGLSLGALK
jgi:sorbitol/mannitol transport system permease protein